YRRKRCFADRLHIACIERSCERPLPPRQIGEPRFFRAGKLEYGRRGGAEPANRAEGGWMTRDVLARDRCKSHGAQPLLRTREVARERLRQAQPIGIRVDGKSRQGRRRSGARDSGCDRGVTCKQVLLKLALKRCEQS